MKSDPTHKKIKTLMCKTLFSLAVGLHLLIHFSMNHFPRWTSPRGRAKQHVPGHHQEIWQPWLHSFHHFICEDSRKHQNRQHCGVSSSLIWKVPPNKGQRLQKTEGLPAHFRINWSTADSCVEEENSGWKKGPELCMTPKGARKGAYLWKNWKKTKYSSFYCGVDESICLEGKKH